MSKSIRHERSFSSEDALYVRFEACVQRDEKKPIYCCDGTYEYPSRKPKVPRFGHLKNCTVDDLFA